MYKQAIRRPNIFVQRPQQMGTSMNEKSVVELDHHKSSLQVQVMTSKKGEDSRLRNIDLQAKQSFTDSSPNLIQEENNKALDHRLMKEGCHHRSDDSLRNSETRNEYL